MIISSEIENVEKVENLTKKITKPEKSILRAFARTRAKKGSHVVLDYRSIDLPSLFMLYKDQVLKACEH